VNSFHIKVYLYILLMKSKSGTKKEVLIKHPPHDKKLIEASMEKDDSIILSFSDKLQLKKNIEKLKKHELLQIYYILQNEEKNKYTKNYNGIWFDLLKLKASTQIKIYNYVNICISNNKNQESPLNSFF